MAMYTDEQLADMVPLIKFRIVTNNVPRDIVDASDLTLAERADHDYLNWDAIREGTESASFIRYRGETYLLSDFSADWGITRGTGLPAEFSGWHGYLSDSYFSGVVIRWADENCESVVVGRFYC